MDRCCRLKLGGLALMVAVGSCSQQPFEAGFWFERVQFESVGTGALTKADLDRIAAVARSELSCALAGLRITLSDRHDATYRVRVVQELQDLRFPYNKGGPAGESHAIPGFGGSGAVNFTLLASNAVGYAPPGASRADVVAAIGRGVGRAAVHEFAHQLVPKMAIDDRTNIRSYEYGFAGRAEQYWGELEWGPAWPLLQERTRVRPAPAARCPV